MRQELPTFLIGNICTQSLLSNKHHFPAFLTLEKIISFKKKSGLAGLAA
jgi:hypothetical protein